MTQGNNSFQSVVTSLWFRLIGIAILASVFAEALYLVSSGKADGWGFYLTTPEVFFEAVVRLIAVALAGVALGTVCTAVMAPILGYFEKSRARLAEEATTVAVVLALYLDSRFALKVLIKWSNRLAGWPVTVLFAVHALAFAAALFIPRGRKLVRSNFDDILSDKMTRRIALATGVASAGLVAAEWTVGKVTAVGVSSAAAPRPSGPNILLITFDAMSAEDMSLYGYRLPTTPRLNEFAAKSSVFTNFYSASTFTTPSVATILTGVYPSEHRVYHLQGRFGGEYAGRTLPHLIRAGGYSTGASISNPYAYFLVEGVDFSSLPDHPAYRTTEFDLWRAAGMLHQRQPYGSRASELMDLDEIRDYSGERLDSYSPRLFGRTLSDAPPATSFAQAREVMDRLPDGFFMWVHILAPHSPYLPSPPSLGRFLPRGEMMSVQQQKLQWWYYKPEVQYLVDKLRLRYDEYVADADGAFGSFLAGLEGAGRLNNTVVMVAADHGESFEGGFYAHDSPEQARPVLHIPLIVRMPGQEHGRRLTMVADQTVLAPTLLDIAGQPRPSWLRGQSLVPLLNSDEGGEGKGLAFTEYFGRNSVYAPLRHGTVGVIDGRHQYVLDLASQTGKLRPLNEPYTWTQDRSAENPALAETLRAAIYSRFPDLPRTKA